MTKSPKTAPVPASDLQPVDQLILALTALVNDRDSARNIKHLFLNQRSGDLQVSLDMHVPD